jgi:predicted molibdopterin-dependent oxidoreductase YjgC
MNKCILCTRCVRACAEVQGRFVWSQAERGFNTHIVAGAGTDMLDARCESCGACVAYCPTGALDNKMSIEAGVPDRVVTTTCTYCGVGCQLDLNIKDDHIIRVTSNPNAPVNGMHLCVKGRYGYDFVHHPDRLTKPKVRKYLLDGTPRPKDRGEWVEVDWDTALEITARKLRFTRDTLGPDSGGCPVLGQVPQRRKLPDEQVGPPGGRDEQHRPLRPSLTLQHRGRSGHFLRLGRYVQLDGRCSE